MQLAWRISGVIFVLILCLASPLSIPKSGHASNVGHPKNKTRPPAAVRRHEYGPTLRLALPDGSPVIDPALVADEDNVMLANLLYSGLVRLDDHYHVVPAAAERVAVSPNHRTYTFYLRPHLRFSNGDPVTASDFAYSITRSLSPQLHSTSAPTYLLDIEGASAVLAGTATRVVGIRVLNASTLQLTARWPVPYFLTELAYPTSYVLDARVINKHGPIDNTSWYSDPVGTGPFRLESWSPGSRLTLVPNKYYFGPKPRIASITIDLGSLPADDLYQYSSQNLDAVTLGPVDPTLSAEPGIEQTQMLAIDGVYMNMKIGPFKNPDVRWALTLATRRNWAVWHSLGPEAAPFAGYVPAGEAGFDPWLHTSGFNPVQARRALTLAGYGPAHPLPALTLYFADDPNLDQLAHLLARTWHQVLHITVSTQALTINTLFAKVQSGALPLYLFGWSADYPDPHDWLSQQWRSDAVNNNVHFVDRRFNWLVENADVTWNWPKRVRLYDQAQQVLANDAAWIPLYIPLRTAYIRPGVINLSVTGMGIMPAGGDWAQVAIVPPLPDRHHL